MCKITDVKGRGLATTCCSRRKAIERSSTKEKDNKSMIKQIKEIGCMQEGSKVIKSLLIARSREQ